MLINKTDMKVNKIQIRYLAHQSKVWPKMFLMCLPPVGFPNTTLIVPPQL